MSVRQINNLLSLLEFFAQRQSPATLADVIKHFGWPRSSAFNILSTLVEAGYLYEPRARAGYYPSPRWNQLIDAISQAEPVPDTLRTIIHQLAEETGETTWIAAPSGRMAVLLDVVESAAPIRYAARVGKRVPIHMTASGITLLAAMPARDREGILRKVDFAGGRKDAPKSVDAVIELIETGRASGYLYSVEWHSEGLGGVAVPVRLNDRIFSIAVAGPLYRMDGRWTHHAEAIQRAIAADLGAECFVWPMETA